MTNIAEYGNKSHAQKNRPVFFPVCEKMTIFADAFPVCEKMTIFADANIQGQRSLR